MEFLHDFSLAELKEKFSASGLPAFRAKQTYEWLTRYADFDEMSNLPKPLRDELKKSYSARPLEILKTLVSRDGTRKYLYALFDGNVIEGALMKQDYGNTICVSTQVGCRMGCGFCASGIGGLVRNLTAGEILAQVLAVNRDLGGGAERKITNIVLMGSGEPLDNYDEVVKFLRLVSCADGINISERNISLSTCGLVDKIYRFADDGFKANLSVSLHATTDEYRRSVMPIAKKYSIAQIVDAVKYYFDKSGRRIIFEYTMLKDINMSDDDCKRLRKLTAGYPSHVNLIMLNRVEEKDVKGCTIEEGEAFCKKLTDLGVSATIRKSKGADVGGACGQLRRKYAEGAL
jgi:23S rRNA (adenine2503-C2)-methyltransferase